MALDTLKRYKDKHSSHTPYYDIRTHEEREIEYELLTQQFIEILERLVKLKSDDEDVFDNDRNEKFYKYNPSHKMTPPVELVKPLVTSTNRPISYSPLYPHHQNHLRPNTFYHDDQTNELNYEFRRPKYYKLKGRKERKQKEEVIFK